jgi:hypothetical protein
MCCFPSARRCGHDHDMRRRRSCARNIGETLGTSLERVLRDLTLKVLPARPFASLRYSLIRGAGRPTDQNRIVLTARGPLGHPGRGLFL